QARGRRWPPRAGSPAPTTTATARWWRCGYLWRTRRRPRRRAEPSPPPARRRCGPDSSGSLLFALGGLVGGEPAGVVPRLLRDVGALVQRLGQASVPVTVGFPVGQ